MSAELLGPTSLVVGQSFSTIQFFLPPLSQVRKADYATNPDIVGDVRLGELAAITVTTAVGAIVASLTRSAIPLFAGLVTSFVLVCVYETALQGTRVGDPTPTDRMRSAEK